MLELAQVLKGQRVAIVGNGPEKEDHSQAIDGADIVIRFNHFYRMKEGKTGRKTSIIFQTFTSTWMNAEDKGAKILNEFNPWIIIAKKPQQLRKECHKFIGNLIKVTDYTREIMPFSRFTTGGAVLCWLAKNACFGASSVSVYGFDGGEAWKSYIKTDAKRYACVATQERAEVDKAIAILTQINAEHTEREEIPRCIVIPIKKNSTGAPNKNRELLDNAVATCAKTGERIDILTDDADAHLYVRDELRERFNTVLVPNIDTLTDITDTLRQWRGQTHFNGRVALVQATTPNTTHEQIAEAFKLLEFSNLVATFAPFEKKPSALYYISEQNGNILQRACPTFPTASAPRQVLPRTFILTGGITAFHTDALDFMSIYDAGEPFPLFVKNAIDVDTVQELSDAKKYIEEKKKHD